MTAIIRVKRHRGEDPVEALVLSCKRKKTEDDEKDSDLFEKILNFSGTVEEKDDKVAANTVETFKKESKYSYINKQHVPDIKLKQRKEWKARSDNSRFTLLSCLRSSSVPEEGEEEGKGDVHNEKGKNFTIVDVSRENDANLTSYSTSDGSFVYDLYSAHLESDADFNDLYMENLLSVQPLEYDLEYRNGEDCFEEMDPDEDDSNDENNWRNDYPDSDPDSDGDDDDDDILAKQLKGFSLGRDADDDDCQLSSDSDEEKYLNYTDDANYCYYEAEDLAGKRYARYKANAMKQMMKNTDDEDDDDDDDDDDDFSDCKDYFANSD